jgi:hypothetical protein
VLDEVVMEHSDHRVVMLGLAAISLAGRSHWFKALEATSPRASEYRPHFHVLMALPAAYCDAESSAYIHQSHWRERAAAKLDYDPIVDIHVVQNVHEIAKYCTKPSDYLVQLPNWIWRYDMVKLETLHCALSGRRMVSWSRSLSPLRKQLGFLDGSAQFDAPTVQSLSSFD